MALQPRLAHEAGDPAAAHHDAALPQLVGDAGTALETTPLPEGVGDKVRYESITPSTDAGPSRLPGIEAASRHAVNSAHHLDRKPVPVCLEESEGLRFRSRANRIAFFSSSCSI